MKNTVPNNQVHIINNIAMQQFINFHYVINSIVFSAIGIIILVISFVVIEKITPQDLMKEILEKQNKALAIVAAAFILAIAIIISSAIHD